MVIGKTLLLVLKTLAFWIVLLAATVLATRLVPILLPPPPAHDGPFTTGQALLVVNALTAGVLAMIAARANVRGWRLAGLLFVALFVGGSLVLQIDTYYFMQYVALPLTSGAITALLLQAGIVAILAAALGAAMFRPVREPPRALPSNMAVRVAWAGLAYIVLYYAAGALIAWSSEAVRAHYGNGAHFRPLEMLAFEYFRGILWSLTALYVVTRLKGSLVSRALVMSILFAVLINVGMLYPNAGLTWDVRQMHLMEVGTSEFLYGLISTVLLLGRVKRPLGAASPWRLIAGQA